jgi:hypothetical protein
MKTKLFLIGVTAGLALCGCEKPVPPYVPPTAEESFKSAEADQWSYSDAGRFVPIHASDKIAILDTKLGNIFYFDLGNQKWVKITSPMATTNYQKINPFDLIPPSGKGYDVLEPEAAPVAKEIPPWEQTNKLGFIPDKK